MYRVELKALEVFLGPPATTLFLMYRVELKVRPYQDRRRLSRRS